jgi:hypothetical protein
MRKTIALRRIVDCEILILLYNPDSLPRQERPVAAILFRIPRNSDPKIGFGLVNEAGPGS